MSVAYIFNDPAPMIKTERGEEKNRRFEKVRLCNQYLKEVGFWEKLEIHHAEPASIDEMASFHDRGYLEFLQILTPENMNDHKALCKKYTVGTDPIECPVYEGLFKEASLVAGGSLLGARLLNEGKAHVAIHWQGGDHHPGADDASGFGYVNDCVLAIQELQKKHERVLYVDIDIHHGDGVEGAFLESNRVMTASFHKYGDGYMVDENRSKGKRQRRKFYPGTGKLLDCGKGKGKYYTINVPIQHGATDETYVGGLFKPIITEIMETFKPDAVVMECGADSLSGDELGLFHLSIEGHAECVQHVLSYNKPTLLLGGGGYGNPANPARCWVYETGVALGIRRIPKWLTKIDPSEETMYEVPPKGKIGDRRVDEEIERVCNRVFDHLSHVKSAEEVRREEEEEARLAAEEAAAEEEEVEEEEERRKSPAAAAVAPKDQQEQEHQLDPSTSPGEEARRKSKSGSAAIPSPKKKRESAGEGALDGQLNGVAEAPEARAVISIGDDGTEHAGCEAADPESPAKKKLKV